MMTVEPKLYVSCQILTLLRWHKLTCLHTC